MSKCFLIGYPVAHSLSPAMFRAAFAACGLDWTYEAVPVLPGRVGSALAELRERGALGINVTMPHKEEVLPYLDRLTSRAQAVRAANTLSWMSREEGWEGDNTDWPGLVAALSQAGLPPRGEAVLFGAGGAARAAAFALAEQGLTVTVVNRSLAPGEELASRLRRWRPGEHRFLRWEDPALPGVLEGAVAVVNATPLGMGELRERSPLPAGQRLRPGCLACDLVYHPPETLFLRQAERAGARSVPGLEVLLWQGALAFQRWTDLAAPVEKMRAALYARASGRAEVAK